MALTLDKTFILLGAGFLLWELKGLYQMTSKVSFDLKIICAMIGSELLMTVNCSSTKRNKSQQFCNESWRANPNILCYQNKENEAHRKKVSQLVEEQTETQIS